MASTLRIAVSWSFSINGLQFLYLYLFTASGEGDTPSPYPTPRRLWRRYPPRAFGARPPLR